MKDRVIALIFLSERVMRKAQSSVVALSTPLDIFNGARFLAWRLKINVRCEENNRFSGLIFSVFEGGGAESGPFLFFTSFLVSDSQKAKIFSGWLDDVQLQRYSRDGFA